MVAYDEQIEFNLLFT